MNGSAEFLAKVALGFVRYTISSRERSYEMSREPDPDLYDFSALLAACRKHLAGTDLNQDQHDRIRVVAQAVDELLKAPSPKPEELQSVRGHESA
jgi:hypothetical protein